MTPGLYIEFIVPKDDPYFDPSTYGDTVKEGRWKVYPEGAYVTVRVEADVIEHDGAGGVFAQFVGAEDHTYLSDENLPVWKVVTE